MTSGGDQLKENALNALRVILPRTTLKAKEAAKYLGISYCKLLELAKSRKIPHIRAGSRVLFRKESLDRWMTDQETSSLSSDDIQGTYGTLRRLRG
jgi:excisionase family DNA binding protein